MNFLPLPTDLETPPVGLVETLERSLRPGPTGSSPGLRAGEAGAGPRRSARADAVSPVVRMDVEGVRSLSTLLAPFLSQLLSCLRLAVRLVDPYTVPRSFGGSGVACGRTARGEWRGRRLGPGRGLVDCAGAAVLDVGGVCRPEWRWSWPYQLKNPVAEHLRVLDATEPVGEVGSAPQGLELCLGVGAVLIASIMRRPRIHPRGVVQRRRVASKTRVSSTSSTRGPAKVVTAATTSPRRSGKCSPSTPSLMR